MEKYCDLTGQLPRRWEVWVELDEIGYRGWAKVRAMEPCPEIRAGDGRVVTATLNHYNSYGYELRLQYLGSRKEDGGISSNGEQCQILNQNSSLLNPTDRYPIFSETRQEWVRAADLQAGELLKTAVGSVRLESIARVPGMHRVYNLYVTVLLRCFAVRGRWRILQRDFGLTGRWELGVSWGECYQKSEHLTSIEPVMTNQSEKC